MGKVDLNFMPNVPVFDANAALGRRHDKRVNVDTVEGTIAEMDRTGVTKALVYAPHGAAYDSTEGNQILLETIGNNDRLVPQFCANPTFDKIDDFSKSVNSANVKTIRIFPPLHNYPFSEWVVGEWLDWAESENIAVWIPVNYETNWHGALDIDPTQLHDTLKNRPNVNVIISEIKYADFPWIMPLIRSLPNISVEISRWVIIDGIQRLINAVGDQRILFGSRFPDSPMSPQLYNLHHNDLSDSSLKDICAGNTERLTGVKLS